MPNLSSDGHSSIQELDHEQYYYVPNSIMERTDLSTEAKFLYGVLFGHQQKLTTGHKPTLKSLARAMGTSPKVIRFALDDLQGAGYVTWKCGLYCISYTLFPPQEER